MPVTLSQAQQNATADIDVAVINEFRKISWIADNLTFDDVVNPAGGGATLTYSYRRQVDQRSAQFRALNSEYAPQETTTQPFSTDLKVLGGSFQVDRVIAKIGPAATAEVARQTADLLTAVKAKFADSVINGDSATDGNGFDGLSKALRGSATEVGADTTVDWTTIDTKAEAIMEIGRLDDWLSLLDGTPTAILGNKKALSKFKVIALWGDFYEKTTDSMGRKVESYAGIPLIDLGAKDGSNLDVIGIGNRDVDSSQFTVTVTGAPTGGTFTLTADGQATAAIPFNATAAQVTKAINDLGTVQDVTTSGSGPYTVSFKDDDAHTLVLGTNSLTGGSAPSVTTAAAGSTAITTGLTDLYAVRFALDGFHGVSTLGGQLMQTWAPDFTTAGAVKTGEAEMGPVGVALKKTKAAAVLRNVKVQ